MALYRNVAGFLEPDANRQVGLTLSQMYDRVNQVLVPYLPAETNAPAEYTTGGPYIIKDFTQPPVPTINVDPSPATEQNAQPTEIPSDSTPEPGAPTQPVPSNIQKNILPLLTLAGLVLVAVKGEDLLRNKKKIVYVAGLGALYYSMAKNSTNG